jgi:hypothetical protein
MGPKKGKSADEKREAILKIYHETKQPFNLKEIEKEGYKVGVVQQTIKDINQSLVDDAFVQADKIGSGVFFWSFPSKELNDRQVKLKGLENALQRSQDNISVLKEATRVAEQSRKATDRPAKMARLQVLQQEESQLSSLLEINKQVSEYIYFHIFMPIPMVYIYRIGSGIGICICTCICICT